MDLMLIIEMLPKIFEFLPFLNPDLKFMIGDKSFLQTWRPRWIRETRRRRTNYRCCHKMEGSSRVVDHPLTSDCRGATETQPFSWWTTVTAMDASQRRCTFQLKETSTRHCRECREGDLQKDAKGSVRSASKQCGIGDKDSDKENLWAGVVGWIGELRCSLDNGSLGNEGHHFPHRSSQSGQKPSGHPNQHLLVMAMNGRTESITMFP